MRKVCGVFLAASLLAPMAQAGKLVCWTDENGRKACGDRLPPQYAKQERQILDAQGRVVSTESRQKTSEELAEERRQAEAAEAEKTRLAKQIKYDKYLTQTFVTVQDLEASRDSRLRSLDSNLNLTAKADVDNEAALQKLKAKADAAKAGGKPVEPNLQKQIDQYEKTLAESKQVRQQRLKEREALSQKFAADISRYNALRSGQIKAGAVAGAETSITTQ